MKTMVWRTHRKISKSPAVKLNSGQGNKNPNFIDIEWLQEWFWALILVSKVWLQWGWRPLFIGWRPALILKGSEFLPVKNLIPLLIPQINPWSFLRRINDLEILDSFGKIAALIGGGIARNQSLKLRVLFGVGILPASVFPAFLPRLLGSSCDLGLKLKIWIFATSLLWMGRANSS